MIEVVFYLVAAALVYCEQYLAAFTVIAWGHQMMVNHSLMTHLWTIQKLIEPRERE